MKLSQRVYNWMYPPKPSAKSAKRLYSASKFWRQNADWTMTPYGANWTLYRDLRALRARSRDAVANHPHFRKLVLMAMSNVIGPKGLQLQCRAYMGRGGKLDTKLNKLVGETFWKWGLSENCTATGKMSWIAAQRLFITHLIRDGECLVQLVKGDNPFGFALKFWNVDYLDETYTEALPGGRRIIMSVEVDANDRPVAYWLTTPASEINFTQRRERSRTRIPADQMIHAFIVGDDESQVRGVPWLHATLLEGRNLHTYKASVQESAKMTAMSGGFLSKKSPDETDYQGGDNEDGVPQDMGIDFTPASFHVLPDDMTFQQFDPKQPTQNHAEFVKTQIRDIATGNGVNYFSLAGDMGDVNYSSARVGLGEERDIWRMLQDTVADCFCRPVYHAWARAALVNQQLTLDDRQFREIQNPVFRPRGWRYVDPQKEIGANVEALANKLATWTDVLAEQGIDLQEHLQTLQSEQELAAQYGVELEVADTAPPPAQAKPEPDDAGDDKKEPPPGEADRGFTNGKYAN